MWLRVTAPVALGSALLGSTRATAATVRVAAGTDLQPAIDGAHGGDTIMLSPGVTYMGNFILPAHMDDERPITIRTAGSDVVPAGQRISPAKASKLARLQSPDARPTVRTARGARFWRLELLEIASVTDGAREIVALGDGSSLQREPHDVASDLVLDRLYIHGADGAAARRGIALNAARTSITNSYVANIKARDADSQAIGGWNGPGDYLIENNYLEAAGENLMFGGADPTIERLTPTHLIIRGNLLTKPLAWRGSRWQVKNLFELKNARDVVVDHNVLEHSWQQAQSGYAVLFTVRNQDGGCPWCQVEAVRFEHNIVRNVAAGVQILGVDNNHPSRQTQNIVIRDNLFDDVDARRWGGDGYFLQMTNNPRDVTVDHNTVVQGTASGLIKLEGRTEVFVFTNNVANHGTYGIIATNRSVGNDSINVALPGATIRGNVIAGGDSRLYPRSNFFPSVEELRNQFVDSAGGDFRLSPLSPWTKGADGRPAGASFSDLPRKLARTP